MRPPVTAQETARELLEFACEHLEPDQTQALDLWLQGASFEDLASAQSSSPEAARRVLRAAIARLRRQFGTPYSEAAND
jgi:DNA-directed RNA polymerase specialized sigma24 family protein